MEKYTKAQMEVIEFENEDIRCYIVKCFIWHPFQKRL